MLSSELERSSQADNGRDAIMGHGAQDQFCWKFSAVQRPADGTAQGVGPRIRQMKPAFGRAIAFGGTGVAWLTLLRISFNSPMSDEASA